MQLRWSGRRNIGSYGNDGKLPTFLMLQVVEVQVAAVQVAAVCEVWCHCCCCLQVHEQMLAREHLEVWSPGMR